jgi:hypothetical protein
MLSSEILTGYSLLIFVSNKLGSWCENYLCNDDESATLGYNMTDDIECHACDSKCSSMRASLCNHFLIYKIVGNGVSNIQTVRQIAVH